MLSKILSKQFCADCRFCCAFSEPSLWEMPAGVKPCGSVDGEQPCEHLDPASGCKLGEDKPDECKMWPLRVMRFQGRRYITLSMRCKAYSELFYQNVLQLLSSGLRRKIIKLADERPEIVREYHESYRLVSCIDQKREPLQFARATVDDVPRVYEAVCDAGYEICQFSVGFIIALSEKYSTRCCFENGSMFVYLKSRSTARHAAYLLPTGDLAQALPRLYEHAAFLGRRPLIWGLTPENAALLRMSGCRFSLREDRDWWDYLYDTAALATLDEPQYRKKHTAMKKFMRDFEGRYEYHTIDRSSLARVAKYQKYWLDKRFEQAGFSTELAGENNQINYILEHFEVLGATGGFVTVDGKIGGYTLAVPINKTTCDVTTLKSSREFGNITVFLVSRFCEDISSRFQYVNFEEDIGNEGLRKFKLDFKPIRLIEKSRAALSLRRLYTTTQKYRRE